MAAPGDARPNASAPSSSTASPGTPNAHVTAARRDSVAARRDPDDQLVHQQRRWRGGSPRRDRRRSSADRRSRPPGRAARRRRTPPRTPACHGRASSPPFRRARRPCPALASQAGAGGAKPSRPSGAATSVSGPLKTTTARAAPRRFERALGLGPLDLAEQPPELALVRGDDRVLAAQPLGIAELADRVGVDHFGRLRGQRQRQHLGDVAHSRARRAGSRCARR